MRLHLTYTVRSIAIPTKPNGGNHTVLFAEAAATPEAHSATINVAKALAVTGSRVLTDDSFLAEVRVITNGRYIMR
jgi:hypothetical protein